MKNCKMFYLQNCPYCKRAFSYLEELQKEKQYCDIKIEKIEERENKSLADSYDYYYVPCFYVNEEKVFEGAIGKKELQTILDKVKE